MKKKVLIWSNSPYMPTGFGTVVRNIADVLHKSEECTVEVVGGGKSFDSQGRATVFPERSDECPYFVYSHTDNTQFNEVLLEKLILHGNYDILLALCDCDLHKPMQSLIDVARNKHGKTTALVIYSPVDSSQYRRGETYADWHRCDVPVAFTEFGRKVAIEANPELEGKLQVIYHGCEQRMFYPLPHRLRRQARANVRQSTDETFLVLNVSQNQPRKDLGRSMAIFREFHKTHEESRLYIHTKENGVGGPLSLMAAVMGLHELILPERMYLPRSEMNLIYNAADVLISTSLGEGWGLSVTEAMTAGIPVVVPRNTSLVEIIGEHEERGYLADCGVGEDAWTIIYGFEVNPRPLTSQRSMLEKLEQVYRDRRGLEYTGKTREKIEAARQWAMSHTWKKIGAQWIELFERIV